MDGPFRPEGRTLVIEFQFDRNVQDRIELAYRRLEMHANAENQIEDSVQDDFLESPNMAAFVSEIHG